jgi:hypothetical protein
MQNGKKSSVCNTLLTVKGLLEKESLKVSHGGHGKQTPSLDVWLIKELPLVNE